MHPISTSTLNNIISLLHQGVSHHDIYLRTGVGLGTISHVHQKHCPGLSKAKEGQPPKLSATAVCQAVHLTTNGSASTAAAAARVMQDTLGEPVHPAALWWALKKAGLKAVTKKKKPALKPAQKKAHFEFAEHHLHWAVEDWKQVVYSDETKINHLGSDGRHWAWKRPGEGLSDHLVQPTSSLVVVQ